MQVLMKRHVVDGKKTFVPNDVVKVEGNLNWSKDDVLKMEKKGLVTVISIKAEKADD